MYQGEFVPLYAGDKDNLSSLNDYWQNNQLGRTAKEFKAEQEVLIDSFESSLNTTSDSHVLDVSSDSSRGSDRPQSLTLSSILNKKRPRTHSGMNIVYIYISIPSSPIYIFSLPNIEDVYKSLASGIEMLMILENEFKLSMAIEIWNDDAEHFMKKWEFSDRNALHFFNSLCEYNKFVLLSYMDTFTRERGQRVRDTLRF